MSFCALTLSYFCVSMVIDPVPNFTKQNPLVSIITRITLEIESFTALNSFAVTGKTQKLTGVQLCESIVRYNYYLEYHNENV